MADSFIGLPSPEGTGKKDDAESFLRGGVTIHRQRHTVIAAASPVRDALSTASLAAGSSANLDGTIIAAAKTGKLIAVVMASSVACKWIVKTRSGAVELTMGVVFTGGLSGRPFDRFDPPDKNFCTLAGNGVDTNFRITATNLDGKLAADAYATIFWDEVS